MIIDSTYLCPFLLTNYEAFVAEQFLVERKAYQKVDSGIQFRSIGAKIKLLESIEEKFLDNLS